MNENPVLLDLFWRLRDAGMALSIEQYGWLCQSLERRRGLDSKNDLERLCRRLWVRPSSRFDENIFKREFDRYWNEAAPKPEPASPRPKPPPAKPPPPTETENLTPAPSAASPPQLPDRQAESPERVPTALRSGERPRRQRKKLPPGFTFEPRALPIADRQLRPAVRQLRRPYREGPPVELDWDATLARVEREGKFADVVLLPRSIGRAELLLLIDRSGSTVPFMPLVERLQQSLQRQACTLQTYYFYNCPDEYLYNQPDCTDAAPIDEVLVQCDGDRTVALVVSDAGAARGGFNPQRIELSERFLQRLTPFVRQIAWLNPTRQERWAQTSAAAIAELLDGRMYALDPVGLWRAVRH